MKYGFENNKFYLELTSSSRPHGNMREEHELRAKEIAENYKDIWISFSAGIDSQSIFLSFRNLGVDTKCAFLYLHGYNDQELTNVRFLENKYNFKAHIVDIDVLAIQKEIEQESIDTDTPGTVNLLHKRFLSQLPDSCTFIQENHNPLVFVGSSPDKLWWYQGYYLPQIARSRAFDSLNRSGNYLFWDDSAEFHLSMLEDDVFKGSLYSAQYIDGNGLKRHNNLVDPYDRWDTYIKPIIYGKYWKDDLVYFPKFAGAVENVPYLTGNPEARKHAVIIPYFELIDFLKNTDSRTQRFYENVNYYKLDNRRKPNV